MKKKSEVRQLMEEVRRFARVRDWDRYHTPKNLSLGLLIEAGELAEHFLWVDATDLTPRKRQAIADEIGDVLIHLLNLSSRLGIDPIAATDHKLGKNARKYPVRRVRGKAKKYTEYRTARRRKKE